MLKGALRRSCDAIENGFVTPRRGHFDFVNAEKKHPSCNGCYWLNAFRSRCFSMHLNAPSMHHRMKDRSLDAGGLGAFGTFLRFVLD